MGRSLWHLIRLDGLRLAGITSGSASTGCPMRRSQTSPRVHWDGSKSRAGSAGHGAILFSAEIVKFLSRRCQILSRVVLKRVKQSRFRGIFVST
jgi:hypothetical protein